MNSGLWITFLLSSGRAGRLLTAGRATPPSRFSAGATDDATEHLPNPTAITT